MTRPYFDIAYNYADRVLTGAEPACNWIKLYCKRFVNDLDEKHAWVFDENRAAKALEFGELQFHVKGDYGGKNLLITYEPWQVLFIGQTFGFVMKDTGYRRFNRVMMVCPRKAGKSLMSAATGLYMLLADGEYAPEVLCGATTLSQAMAVFQPACEMVRRNDAMRAAYPLKVAAKGISVLADSASFRPLVSRPGDGGNPHMAILDERHEHVNNDLYNAMRTGMGARKQPLLWTITTAGTDTSGPCYSDVLVGRKILQGNIHNDSQLYAEYTIDETDEWTTMASARKANPNLGISVEESYIQTELNDALQVPHNQTMYRTKYLNIWSQAKSAFHNLHNWNKCFHTKHPKKLGLTDYQNFKIEDYYGREVYMGMDLASKQDIAAIIIFIPLDDDKFAIFGKYYLPSDAVNKTGVNSYTLWRDQGKIDVSEGNMNDFDGIEEDIDELYNNFHVKKIVIDGRLASMQEQHMVTKGYPVESFTPSSVNYTEPMRWLDGQINNQQIVHDSDEQDPLTWMIGNVISKPNKRDMEFPDKERHEFKIDGAVACYMAISAFMMDTGDQIGGSLFSS